MIDGAVGASVTLGLIVQDCCEAHAALMQTAEKLSAADGQYARLLEVQAVGSRLVMQMAHIQQAAEHLRKLSAGLDMMRLAAEAQGA